MIIRSDTILALLPPAIAMAWVIADAATGLVSADRAAQLAPPAVQIVATLETASASASAPAIKTGQNRAPVILCSHYSALEAGIIQLDLYGLPQSNLLTLCQAGLKFTSTLPKI